MSPDERAVEQVVGAALRRARRLVVVEAMALGVFVAAASWAAGLIVAIGYVVWRWPHIGRTNVVQTMERLNAGAQNVLITAEEISAGSLNPSPNVRDRVMAQAAKRAGEVDMRSLFPSVRARQTIIVACAAWLIVAGVRIWRGTTLVPGAAVFESRSIQDPAAAGRFRVTARVEPPAYTGLPSATLVDPAQIQTLQGSTIALSIDSRAMVATLEHDGDRQSLIRTADGRFTGRVVASKTGYLLISTGENVSRTVPVVVSPDALPSVNITVPGRDLVYAGGNARVAFDVRATDDYGLRSLRLQYTKVSGSGEQFEFNEGEIPLSVSRATARDWHGVAARSLDQLELRDGDMLVYRAVAADQRPGDGAASSDAFFIEISKLGVAAGDAFTLPEQETRYALSQQMLIVKTERLQQRRSSMPAAELTDAALNLAVEQRMIRAEFVFMLGGDVQDEEVEAEQSTELQEGRLENRGQRDLRAATVAMSRAEKLLTGVNMAEALVAERAAVTALQRAFARDRYILRALASRANLDPARRLTGDLKDASGWTRPVAPAAENRRAAHLQDLTVGIGAFVRDVRAQAPASAVVLARQALRADAESTALRTAATGLQRVADTWNTTSEAARRQMLEEVASRVAAEAARALAGPPLGATSPAIVGAFGDALRAANGRPGDRR